LLTISVVAVIARVVVSAVTITAHSSEPTGCSHSAG
jgi:hypothetical protein